MGLLVTNEKGNNLIMGRIEWTFSGHQTTVDFTSDVVGACRFSIRFSDFHITLVSIESSACSLIFMVQHSLVGYHANMLLVCLG